MIMMMMMMMMDDDDDDDDDDNNDDNDYVMTPRHSCFSYPGFVEVRMVPARPGMAFVE